MVENKKYLKLARGKPCVRCGSTNGVVACHYSGLFSHALGKGAGRKASDHAVAFLCNTCHTYFDSYAAGNDYERAFEFLLFILKTQQMVLDTGELIWMVSSG